MFARINHERETDLRLPLNPLTIRASALHRFESWSDAINRQLLCGRDAGLKAEVLRDHSR
jgi:hypothetical protein